MNATATVNHQGFRVLQSASFSVWDGMNETPLRERHYPIGFHRDGNGNYVARLTPGGHPFIVMPAVFERVTGLNDDFGALDVTYSQLAAIGGVNV